MDCADAKLRMEPYATGNLASPDREEFEKHIADCESCRLDLDLIRAGVGTRGADEAPAPGQDIIRSGELDFGPGTAFGASSDLDEASFADVASQLSEDFPGAPMADLERAAAPLRPPTEPPTQLSEPPAQLSESPARLSEPPARLTDPPAGPPSPGDYSLDELLANATPSPMIRADSAPEADPLAQVLPAPPAPARPPDRPPAPGVERQAGSAWEFEPVEAARKVAPPEGSLFFAEETLARARDAGVRRKGGAVRFALWVAGGAVGLGLLFFAGWIAWTAHPSGDAARRAAEPSAAPTGSAPPEGATAEPPREAAGAAPEEAAPSPPAESEAPAEEAPPTPQPAPGEAAGDEAGEPVVSASTANPRSPLPDSERPARPRATVPARPEAPLVRKRAPAPVTAPAGKKPPTTAARSVRAAAGTTPSAKPAEPAPTQHAAGTTPRAPETTPPARVTRPEGASVTGATGAEPGVNSPSSAGPAHAAPDSGTPGKVPSTGVSQATQAPEPGEPDAAAPPAVAEPRAGAPPASSGAEGEAAPPATQRPIDRLHLAMVAAEQRGDLGALRNMRATWKGFLQKSGVGPDRVRAKRELADCLWAIQEITGRRSDQRDAFRAYRDYLLNAPAGGADSRSVSRAKQLQDALSESN